MKFSTSIKTGLQLLFAALLACSIANAAETSTPSYPELIFDDIQHVLTKPGDWKTGEWSNVGWASVAVIGTAILIDNPLREEMRRQPSNNGFMLNIERFGAEYSIGVMGSFYLAGKIADNETAILVAQDSLTASIIASGMITPAIKIATGRSRPYENAGNNDFQGLSANKLNSSFPSGHTTEAFTLASVISAHYEEIWIKSSVYTVAAAVGIARIYNDAHFASDILAGALIGNWVGQRVVAHNQIRRERNFVLFPEATQDLIGLRLTGNF